MILEREVKADLAFDFKTKDHVQMLDTKPPKGSKVIPFKILFIGPDDDRSEKTYYITNWNKIKGAEIRVEL